MNEFNNTLADVCGKFSTPRIETAGPILVAGLREPLDEQAAQKIPQLWQRLINTWEQIPQRLPPPDYGLCIHLQNHEYCYMAGCAVWDFTDLPHTFSPFIIPSQTYAVFSHEGKLSQLCETINFAFDQWLPSANYRHARSDNALHFFERYGENFDPQKGEGDIEIWLPVTSRQ